ncbi:MAG TPA: hypothetical protein VKH81_09480, partial [Candidatus Angelobacter sp.]|nr:hypothetical protein [Candidatus Angelobacter sp.]
MELAVNFSPHMKLSALEIGNLWRRLSWPDLAAMVLVSLGGTAMLMRLSGGGYSFLRFLALLSAGYLAFRLIAWGRSRLLWSLRNRL